MRKLLTNSFSFGMLGSRTGEVIHRELTVQEASALAPEFRSTVGHADTAKLFEQQLGHAVPFNRESVSLSKGDELLIGQYVGPRLPEGVLTLPEGASIQWMHVKVA